MTVNPVRQHLRFWTGLLLGCALAPLWAQSGKFPDGPIKMIVPFAPGGGVDTAGRLIAKHMQSRLGVSVVVENRAGANGSVGGKVVQTAAADGQTLLFSGATHVLAKQVMAKAPYDPVTDFAPVARVGEAPLLLVISPNLPEQKLSEVVNSARQNPDKWTAALPAMGAPSHLATLLLAQKSNLKITTVPYKGTAPALTDLMSNSIQVLVDAPSGVGANIRAGKIKALAVFADKRLASYPDVPTIVESGGPKIESSSWVMFFAPAGTPKAIVDKLSLAVRESLKSEELIKRLSDQGIITVGSTPAEADAFLKAEIAKWGNLIKTVGVKAE